jgi:hypothetical protein
MGNVIGFHVIGCTYGFWLPNEKRGSCSDFVRSDALAKFGPANPVDHSRSVARKKYDYEVRQLELCELSYPPVMLTNAQIAAVCRRVAEEIEAFDPAPMYEFVQLRNHFHYVCGRCRYDIRRFAGRIKGAGTKRLLAEGIHPMQKFADARGNVPSPWSVKPWVVYLFDDSDVIRSIKYVRDNLTRAGLPPQRHPFLTEYRGGTPGAAHRR